MSKIRLLQEGLVDKIRAGEVVERPSSVVKELVENSIDSGAGKIAIEIKKAGRRLVSVSDDGEGMDADDALMSLVRHSTSKIGSETDLFDIRTMGFRGEALPSIAAVSRLTLITAKQGDTLGIKIEAEAGVIKETSQTATLGTTVSVRDLFFNTPARMKFLKKDRTEMTQIVETVTRLSLSHPKIGFELSADGNVIIDAPKAKDIRERLMQVYGSEFVDDTLEVEALTNGLEIRAFISKPDRHRLTRSHQMIFVNNRPVREQSLSHAVYSAFEGILPKDRHPIFFVFVTADPRLIDVNVHPAKHEVRFSDKETIYRVLKNSIMDAIRGGFHPADSFAYRDADYGSQTLRANVPYESEMPSSFAVAECLAPEFSSGFSSLYIGDVFSAIAERGGLTLIDHHAAHERVMYEKLLKGGFKLDTMRLLFPRQITLSPLEYKTIVENLAMLNELGLEVEDFGKDSVIVRSIPSDLDGADLRGILSDASGALAEGSGPFDSIREAVAARIACHASVRGSRSLGTEEMKSLVESLDKTGDPNHCPHGRPTRINYSIDDLRRLFKRK